MASQDSPLDITPSPDRDLRGPDLRKAIMNSIDEHRGVHQLIDGSEVFVSGQSGEKISSGRYVSPAQADAAHNLPALLKSAEHVESHEDKRGGGQIDQIHRLVAHMNSGGIVVPVKFTVKEFKRPEPSMAGLNQKLYHMEAMEVG